MPSHGSKSNPHGGTKPKSNSKDKASDALAKGRRRQFSDHAN